MRRSQIQANLLRLDGHFLPTMPLYASQAASKVLLVRFGLETIDDPNGKVP